MLRSSEFWSGLFWIAVGAFVVSAGLDLGIGRVNDPGAGFALFWVGLLLMLLAGLVVASAFARPGLSLRSLWTDTRWGRVLIVIAMLVAFGFFFEQLGFVVCATALLLALMLFIDPVRPWVAVPVAALVPLGVYFVVTKWLKIQIPIGILAGYL